MCACWGVGVAQDACLRGASPHLSPASSTGPANALAPGLGPTARGPPPAGPPSPAVLPSSDFPGGGPRSAEAPPNAASASAASASGACSGKPPPPPTALHLAFTPALRPLGCACSWVLGTGAPPGAGVAVPTCPGPLPGIPEYPAQTEVWSKVRARGARVQHKAMATVRHGATRGGAHCECRASKDQGAGEHMAPGCCCPG